MSWGVGANVGAQVDWGAQPTLPAACHSFPLPHRGTKRPEPAALLEPPRLSELLKFKLHLSSKGLASRQTIKVAFNSDTLSQSSSMSASF